MIPFTHLLSIHDLGLQRLDHLMGGLSTPWMFGWSQRRALGIPVMVGCVTYGAIGMPRGKKTHRTPPRLSPRLTRSLIPGPPLMRSQTHAIRLQHRRVGATIQRVVSRLCVADPEAKTRPLSDI